MERNDMFDALVRGSQGFMNKGKGMVMDGNLQNTSHFGFFMEGYWQGTYDKYIKVRPHKLRYKFDVVNFDLKTYTRELISLAQFSWCTVFTWSLSVSGNETPPSANFLTRQCNVPT